MPDNIWAMVYTSADLGQFLAHVRQERGLTQQELADDLGVSRRYVSEIENGKPGLYSERLFQMMRLLGVRLRAEQFRRYPGESDAALQIADDRTVAVIGQL